MYFNNNQVNGFIPSVPPALVQMPNNHYVQYTSVPVRLTPNRDVEFNYQLADSNEHGPGFKLYKWKFMLNRNEVLVCRLLAAPSEKVISAGFDTGPLAPVNAISNYPRSNNYWITVLQNTSPERLDLFLYLIVKV
ncbi:hypothetical protein [Paenibacillus arenosi]|uniref:Uncharacterized protein n=1 Tax=Paenibacillus arenosi TaxID=2774142 RepID=A0ABR9ATP4_9BACL|nr:hypothetical protein [Paenibacillus arenosi]MBD8497488.1 hypothetical protein [Paenibacillus arenosi]